MDSSVSISAKATPHALLSRYYSSTHVYGMLLDRLLCRVSPRFVNYDYQLKLALAFFDRTEAL